jgi:hypothetical protein
MKETRSGVILTRLARKIREQSGDHRIRARIEDERGSLKTLVRISCTRPICESMNPVRVHVPGAYLSLQTCFAPSQLWPPLV